MLVLLTGRYLMLRNYCRVKLLILNLCRFLPEDAKPYPYLAESKPLGQSYSPQEVPISKELLSYIRHLRPPVSPTQVPAMHPGSSWTLTTAGNTLSLFDHPHVNKSLHGNLS